MNIIISSAILEERKQAIFKIDSALGMEQGDASRPYFSEANTVQSSRL